MHTNRVDLGDNKIIKLPLLKLLSSKYLVF